MAWVRAGGGEVGLRACRAVRSDSGTFAAAYPDHGLISAKNEARFFCRDNGGVEPGGSSGSKKATPFSTTG